MNANEIKLSMSRNSSRALVANVYVNEEEVFATSKGYQLGCALHAMGVDALNQSGGGFTLAVDELGTFLGYKFGEKADERVFHGNLIGGLMLASVTGGKNDPEYHLVRSLLPEHLVTGPATAAPECPEESIEHFKKFIYYPFV
ncbi:hypothetical protein GTP46_11475 [Duganella sp. FT135W]|uniref:Uncharacterized protein n=1 Tax=Duganella flavida TaxID=2692175 RepID=A0A6L8K7A8_9BURK|nr:hypothetical protein [Duganella flavida]MYM23266.1 hypothetical protein [Duganella flavida]